MFNGPPKDKYIFPSDALSLVKNVADTKRAGQFLTGLLSADVFQRSAGNIYLPLGCVIGESGRILLAFELED